MKAKYFLHKILLITLSFTTSVFAAENGTTEFVGDFRGKPYHIIIAKKLSGTEKLAVEKAIQAIWDQATSTYASDNPDSELAKLNQLPVNKKVILSPVLKRLFTSSQTIYAVSGKLFDPTMGSMVTLWTSYLDKGKLPPKEEVQKMCANLGWNTIHLQGTTFWKSSESTTINFGAIFKGFTVDQLINKLQSIGYNNLIINWGGEMRAIGTGPQNQPWRVLVRESRIAHSSDDPKQVLELKNQALGSSGDKYQKKWTINGQTYTNLIDPNTCMPLSRAAFPQVIALANNGAMADGLASVGMFHLSLQDALNWEKKIQNEIPHASIWFVTDQS